MRTKPQEKALENFCDDLNVFIEAMRDVVPIQESTKQRVVVKPEIQVTRYEEDQAREFEEAMVDLRSAFLDFNDSDEYLEGRAADCSRLELSRLKSGDLSIEDSIDLHGMNRIEAREAIGRFFENAQRRSKRCVHIICGRGLGSPGLKPVLKELLSRWLVQGALSRQVLAFCSARPPHGGVGAVYVLLRKRRL